MIFESISLTHLFSYQHADINLSGNTPEKNIVLISGRNGFGKTSFINAIKLLFTGVSDELRSSVQAGRKLSVKAYVLGQGEDWLGILNRHARQQGQNHCAVEIHWREQGLGRVRAQRRWFNITADHYETQLEIELLDEKKWLKEDETQNFLDQRLPEDYIGFFIFDSENIQALAEATRQKQIEQTERLLNISKIDTLIDNLSTLIKDWRKQAQTATQKAQLNRLVTEDKQLEMDILALEAEQGELEEERTELNQRRRDLEHIINRYRAGGEQGRRLIKQQKNLGDALVQQQERLVEALLPNSPLLLNPALITRLNAALAKIESNSAARQSDDLQHVLEDLPDDLLEKPPNPSPALTPEQKRFLKKRLEALITAYIPTPDTIIDGPLMIDSGLARQLSLQSNPYAEIRQEHQDRAHDLQAISQIKRELKQIQNQLDSADHLSGDDQEEFDRHKAEQAEVMQRMGEIKVELDYKHKDIRTKQGERERLSSQIHSQEREVHLNALAERKVKQAQQARDFFQAYKQELRAMKQQELELAINQHFKKLMTSHGMIDHIRLDAQFELHLQDKDRAPLAMGSISAGMKQLVATALLWALKETSGKALPIIIDTPLARIDYQNQLNLLRNYYPHAGEQVIILPTDSELDRSKYAELKPYIYKEYALHNEDGQNTQAISQILYPSEEHAHG